MTTGYDSRPDTYEHIRQVQEYLGHCVRSLLTRMHEHDRSKLVSPEVECFDDCTERLRGLTYGSDEYKACLAEMKPALDHHYAANSHHPEHFRWFCPVCKLHLNEQHASESPEGPNDSGDKYCPRCCRTGILYESQLMRLESGSVRGMTLLDVLEMLCDWKAATLRHANGNIVKSIEMNMVRFGYSDELRQILQNTVQAMGWGGCQ